MDYLYENLGDERFQEFCNSLIAKEFPNTQSFPVGQPDGGRDSLAYFMKSNRKDFNVFQVKFVRNQNQQKDIITWLTEIIKQEAAKVNELVSKGAKNYYLLTNLKGTAHLDAGSKDKINRVLEENIKIPSICWWRDDLSRLLEKDPLFIWSFPQILNGQDVLNSVLFEGLMENKERRKNVINAYLIDQFDIDNEVKFKQIDLQNRLLNLFTDVPLRIKKFNEKNKTLRPALALLDLPKANSIDEENFLYEEKANIGAAEFLLHPTIQRDIERILLEGGPGQGKSTISQYICQVHRARLLNKSSDLDLLPEHIRNSPVRFPLKIDLRDVAAWIERKNPYQGILTQEYFDGVWKNSLESFLTAHVFYHSKLEEFTSSDFIEICKLSPVLFVFDGFDEIANLKVRSEVIEFINKGLTRISANVRSIQVVITSRPAAFSDSVGFSIDHYPHFELTDITLPIINQYVEKWIKASKLNIRDANELRKLMKEKLEMPHLKDLAKSPMQLAIFISLLRTKGQSLPNKRTALYDSYINLFFDRESEKNTLIRDKRDLIIDIHQYLAWMLHSEAEQFKNSGSININDLTARLKDYLTNEGHDTSIAEQLFDVMKERVCALISRVQGTFEFEVQPLREYFCARYLYNSAPHSSAGSVKHGTKPDRLHAILRNFYWQNVVRFFTGCADAGELDMIIQELKDLQNDDILKYTNYPRIITSQILSDYVFTQKPLKLKDVVSIIVNGINIGNIINQDLGFDPNEPLQLPNECGRTQVIEECFDQLVKFPKKDYARELIGIINNNPFDNLQTWCRYAAQFKGVQLTKWLEYAYSLQLVHRIDEALLLRILGEGDISQTQRRLQLLISGNRLELLHKNIEFKQIAFEGVLNYEISMFQRGKGDQSLTYLTLIQHPFILSRMQVDESNATFIDHINIFIEGRGNTDLAKQLNEFNVVDDIDTTIAKFSNSIKELYNTPVNSFKYNIEPWDKLVESSKAFFGDRLSTNVIATIAAGIKGKEEQSEYYEDLNNSAISLCKRVRFARMKSGNIKYWENLLTKSSDTSLTLLVFFSWATPKTIVQLFTPVAEIVKSLNPSSFSTLARSLQRTVNNSTFTQQQDRYVNEQIGNKKNQDEFKYLLSYRFDEPSRQKFIYESIEESAGNVKDIVETKFQYLVKTYLNQPNDANILNEIKKLYKHITYFDDRRHLPHHHNKPIKIAYGIAKKIMKNGREYPRIISSLAEKSCRLYANEQLRPIGEIAKLEKWFEDI